MIFNDLTANENYTKKIKEQLNSFNQELIKELQTPKIIMNTN